MASREILACEFTEFHSCRQFFGAFFAFFGAFFGAFGQAEGRGTSLFHIDSRRRAGIFHAWWYQSFFGAIIMIDIESKTAWARAHH
jgi:hypothetical protein